MSDQIHMTSLFENATEGIILTDSKGVIVLANPASAKMFGYEPQELTGFPVEILLPSSVKHKHEQYREGFYKHPSNRSMGHGRDLYGQKKDGTRLPVEVSLSHYERENEVFVIAFIVDITLRKEQKEELEKITDSMRQLNSTLEVKVEERTSILQEALQQLEQSQQELHEALDKERQLNEIKSRFVSMASHEFRTPLTTILSSASLLAKYENADDAEKRVKHIQRIKNSVSNLNAILEDFLSLGKLNDGKTQTKMEPVQLKEIIEDVTAEMKVVLKKGQHFVVDCDEISLQTDRHLLRNILVNLTSNATKFSAEGKPIRISGKISGSNALIIVADEGIGISEEDQKPLFSSFYRAANATAIQGTGLGLHIVKRYVGLLGGEIKLQSELDKGTTIQFSLPLKENI